MPRPQEHARVVVPRTTACFVPWLPPDPAFSVLNCRDHRLLWPARRIMGTSADVKTTRETETRPLVRRSLLTTRAFRLRNRGSRSDRARTWACSCGPAAPPSAHANETRSRETTEEQLFHLRGGPPRWLAFARTEFVPRTLACANCAPRRIFPSLDDSHRDCPPRPPPLLGGGKEEVKILVSRLPIRHDGRPALLPRTRSSSSDRQWSAVSPMTAPPPAPASQTTT